MPDEKDKEKTVFEALGLAGYTAGGTPAAVDIRQGKIVRIRPLHYDFLLTQR
jgi:trimethylamine-N-oxide reductase (cytochrome c)